GDAARLDHPLCGPEPDRGWPGDQRELLPPRLPGQRGAAERGPRCDADGDRQRLLPLAGVAAPRLREGGAQATLPAIHPDRWDGGEGGGGAAGAGGPPLPQPDRAGGGTGPRPAAHPLDRPPETGVHLSLTPTAVRGLINFRAVEIGVERPV